MLNILKASKRLCKGIKRSLKRCVRRGPPTKSPAQDATVEDLYHSSPPEMASSGMVRSITPRQCTILTLFQLANPFNKGHRKYAGVIGK